MTTSINDQPAARHTDAVSLVLGLVGPPAAWSAHLLVAYFIAGRMCGVSHATQGVLIAVLTIVVEAAIAASLYVALRRSGDGFSSDATRSAPAFLARAAIFSAILYAIATLFTAAPIFLLEGCG
ncbi:MAG TPA: hypothetical protein VFH62_01885 [Dehalococcoidia bacterium]|jgi:hypothetical protein|nr:hypothetical protein [Dehalococcoidia bacterium]